MSATARRPERLLTTVLFTDIVDSTGRAAELGDLRWRDLLQEHNALVRRELERHGGREIGTAGDGFVAVLDEPEDAIRCAVAIREAVRALGLEIRCGLHSGEVQVMGESLGGIAVHIGARVAAQAAPGEVLVSSTVHDLVAGSGIAFRDRGVHPLKGVPGEWRLFAVGGEAVEAEPPPPARRAVWQRGGRAVTGAAAIRTRGLRRLALPALAVILLAAAGWWLWRHRELSTLQASPTSIAVLPFSMRGSKELAYLREGMVDLLSTKLDGAGSLRSVDPRAVLGLVRSSEEEIADPEEGGAIARRLGAGLFILGSIVEAGGRLHVDAGLYDPDRGSSAVARASSEGETARLFELVDKLAAQLLAGQRGGPGARVTRIAAVTTSSLPALKAYLKGESALRVGRFREALDSFQAAVAADSLFALAWYRLSVAAEWSTAGADLIEQGAERAVRYDARLSEHDRQLLQALLDWRRGAAAEAEGRYRAILATYPEDVEAWLQLGEVLFHYGPGAGRSIVESREAWERVLRLEPEHVLSLMHLARIAATQRRWAELDSLVARVVELSPGGDRVLEMVALQAFAREDPGAEARVAGRLESASDGAVLTAIWNVAVFAGDPAGAIDVARLVTRSSRSPEVRALAHTMAAHLEVARGRWSAAENELRTAESLDPSMLVHRALLIVAPFLSPSAQELSDMREELARWKADSVPAHVTPSTQLIVHDGWYPHLRLYLLGQLDVRLRQLTRAAQVADSLERLTAGLEGVLLAPQLAGSIRTEIALARGRTAEALALARATRRPLNYNRQITSPFFAGGHERYVEAELLVSLGRDEEAVRRYRSFAEHSLFDLPYVAPSHLRRAEIHDRLGRRDRAVAHYTEFIKLWKDCDPELRPLAEKAQRRVEELTAAAAD